MGKEKITGGTPVPRVFVVFGVVELLSWVWCLGFPLFGLGDWFATFGAGVCVELVEEVAADAAGFFDLDSDFEFAGLAAGVFVGLGVDG